ncbi:hypothetical protein EB796_003057 [Bugula neritina]|uniref:Uncharacterized protein n=1 Tax=Bugula neritina TaxID=10212 RepID=A0A7J7KLN5_BUGNE|nr:hypothetical protein EB796_003057 [Bugula neritina]
MSSNVLEIHESSEDEMMVTAPSSPLRQSRSLPQRECQDQGTSAAGPKIVESSPQLGIESSSMPGEQMRVVPKATQRVLRNVSASSQERIKQARGEHGNRTCGVCGFQSSGRRSHGIHVAGHFTRHMCDCGHAEGSYQALLPHWRAHGNPQLQITEICLENLEGGGATSIADMATELVSLKKIQRRLERKIKAKEERLRNAVHGTD